MSAPIKNSRSFSSETPLMQLYSKFTSPASAGVAIIPSFYFFHWKSNLQQDLKRPHFNPWTAIKEGARSSPIITAIIGTQMTAQKIIENQINKIDLGKNNKNTSMFISALCVGIASAPALAIFNGQSMGHSPFKSLKSLTLRQVGAITARETSFLLAIRISDPFSKAMRTQLGDNELIEAIATVFSAVIGSAIGHAPDTALTRWQGKLKFRFQDIPKGIMPRTAALIIFSLTYNNVKKVLNFPLEK